MSQPETIERAQGDPGRDPSDQGGPPGLGSGTVGPDGELRVILVHGTWARGFCCIKAPNLKRPRWFESNSDFAKKLLEAVKGPRLKLHPVLEDPLLWSGRNSLLHRARAAQELASRLKQRPDAHWLLVAHSHGGNVVLRALQELGQEQQDRIRVVTLATPFVEIFFPEPKARNYERLQLFGLLLLSAIQFINLHWLIPGVPLSTRLTLAIAFVVPAILVFGAEMTEANAIKHGGSCFARRLFIDAAYPSLRLRPPSLLVLRGVEDEASITIATAAFLGRITQMIRDLIQHLWHKRLFAVLVAGGVLVASITSIVLFVSLYGLEAYDTSPLPRLIPLIGTVMSLFVVVVPAVVCAVAVLARVVCGVAAGRELALLPNLEVSVSTSPDFAIRPPPYHPGREVQVWTIARRGRPAPKLRHSIYEELIDVVGYIEAWLVSCLQSDRFFAGSPWKETGRTQVESAHEQPPPG